MNTSFAPLEKPAEPEHWVRSRQPAGDYPKGVARRVHDHPMLSQAAGNLATQRLLRTGVLQPKLSVTPPGDTYEQEADRVADQVMSSASVPPIQRKCDACAAGGPCPECEEEEKLQTKEVPGHVPQVTPKIESSLTSLRGGGQPLAPSVRAFFEPRFGRDFSGVRVHTDTTGAQSAKEIHARAYTVGSDVVFGDGQFSPSTSEGRTLLAHELVHTVQQGGEAAAIQRAPAPDLRGSRDVNAARYRGQQIATRIRKHTKLSDEVRAKINSELGYFEGAAKEAYIREIRPALLAVVEIERPEERVVKRGPSPIGLSLLADPYLCGGSKCFTDEDIYKPLTEMERREEEEKALLREGEMKKLRDKTKDWLTEDQAFALELLGRVIRDRTNVDPRAVSDAIRQPILDRYERWLRTVDTMRLAKCPELGVLEKTRARASGDDPCKSWFADEYSHGPSELLDLERQLRVHRGSGSSAVDQVYWDVFDYRKKTDPKMLEQYQIAAALVNLGVAVAAGVGAKVNAPPSIPVGGFRVSGLKAGYKIQICNDSTVIEGPTSYSKIGIQTREAGGALTDPATKTIWVNESVVIANGIVRKWGARLNFKQVTAHEMGHAEMDGGTCAMASRKGADMPWLTTAERMGLLDDAVHIRRDAGLGLDGLDLPPGYRPPPPTPKAP